MTRIILLLVISSILLTSCKKNNENSSLITKSEIKGAVQKGPFLNGTAIDVYELDAGLVTTGKSFSSQIMDNSGLFELKNLSLISQYVQIKANGYYFNEITGVNSVSPVILFALTDITDKNSVNVNVLSHLAKSRVEFLIQNEGKSFSESTIQAKQEVLNIFSMQKSDINDFDMLNITEDGDDNAILLAISLITQGYRTESELSDLLANINTDIREDGVLNSSALGSLLINDTRLLNLPDIREKLENRYQDLGLSVTIPDFEVYVNKFIDSTTYVITNNIDYPEISNYLKTNILFPTSQEMISLRAYVDYSMAADLPKGTALKVTIEPLNPDSLPNMGYFGVQMLPDGPINFQLDVNSNEEIKTLTSIESGYCDALVSFLFMGDYLLKIYENGSELPATIKTITVENY